METTRKVVNVLFMIIVGGGLIFLLVLLIGGAFPINMGMGDQAVKFDVARIGWDPDDAADFFTIVHEDNLKKKGWGALQFDYKYKEGKYPGLHSTAYPMEGILSISVWMKAKNPCLWQIKIKRKSDGKVFKVTFKVDKTWKKHTFTASDFKEQTKHEGKFDRLDFAKWLNLVDVGENKRTGERNTVWIDDLVITR